MDESLEVEATVVYKTEFRETMGVRYARTHNGTGLFFGERLVVHKDLADTRKRKGRHVDTGILFMDLIDTTVFLEEAVGFFGTDLKEIGIVIGAAHDAEIKKLGTGHA